MFVVSFTFLCGGFDSFSVTSKSGSFEIVENEFDNSETPLGC